MKEEDLKVRKSFEGKLIIKKMYENKLGSVENHHSNVWHMLACADPSILPSLEFYYVLLFSLTFYE